MRADATEPPSSLRLRDLLPTATGGLRSRPLRAALSALGIAIGVSAVVAVLGITRSSESDLVARIDRLGTNLLTVVDGRSLEGQETELPVRATRMIRRVEGVVHVAATAQLPGVSVYRTRAVPVFETGGLAVRAAGPGVLGTLDGTVGHGRFLNAATARYPAAVLGFEAARMLGIAHVDRLARVWIGRRYFSVVGILDRLPLAPEIDRSVLVGMPVARRLLGFDGHPSRIYVRAETARVTDVARLLAPSANPESPNEVEVSRPSDALAARIAVAGASTLLFLALGAIALVVAGIGIANLMVISVLERRSEIGLRRALGATRSHIALQFLTESLLLSALGGALGVLAGIAATLGAAGFGHWAVLVPAIAIWGGLGAALAIGALAGLYPALVAARLSPTEALRSV